MSNQKHKSKIGGQALIEGVMMRGIDKSAMACRLPNGDIDVEEWGIKNGKDAPWYKKAPIIRGSFNFISSMVDGYKCLSKSAEKQGDDAEEMSKFEKWLDEKIGDKLMPLVMTLAVILGVALALLLFMWFPMTISKLLERFVSNRFLLTLIEGIIKIIIFIIYLALVSRMKDIKRTFQYHGAEHKSIACYEAGEELTVENVKKHTRFHPRCGTSFILISFIISIIIFSVVTWKSKLVRMALKLILLPIVIGIAYEIIKLAGKYDNVVTRVISAPGLWLQRLTTKEPDDSQIEVAIAALTPVIPENKEDDQW